jgi:hypothetical protein
MAAGPLPEAAAQVACGATITTDTTLTPGDPIATAACKTNGISIGGAGVTLDCGGLTIKGSGGGTGIRLVSRAESVTIQNCVVEGFQKGLHLPGIGNNFLANVVAQGNKSAGVVANSDFNLFLGVVARGNGIGFQLSGTGNALDGAIALENAKAGFSIKGAEQDIQNSMAIGNGAQGFSANIKSSLLFNNSAMDNRGAGFDIKGGTINLPNDYSDNKAFANGRNGLVVAGKNPDANFDSGGNVGLANTGAIQCQIAGVPCQQ